MSRLATGTSLLDPQRILRIAGAGFGMTVADLGCGAAAYFVLEAAHVVGNKGRAYGVDILQSALKGMMSKAKLSGHTNIEPVWSNLEMVGGAKKIRDGSLDIALLVNLLSQTRQHENVFREARRMLRPKGKMVVVDWQEAAGPFGPTADRRVSPNAARSVAQVAGFREEKSFEAGPYHYGLIFEKA